MDRKAGVKRNPDRLQIFEASRRGLPTGIALPEKDWPILLAAMEASATPLVTGDVRHFGAYFGKRVEGVLIVTPAEYLRGQRMLKS
jgi:hypothetical protein